MQMDNDASFNRPISIAVVIAVACCPFADAQIVGDLPERRSADAELRRLLDEAWERRLDDQPLFATRLGDPRGAGKLPRVDLATQRSQLAHQRQMLRRLDAIDRDDLSRSNHTNYDMFLRSVRLAIREWELQTHLTPITNRSGFHISFPELPQLEPPHSAQDYRHYVARLRQFRRYAKDHIQLMRAGIEAGQVLPAIVLEGVEKTLDPHIVEAPEESLLFAPFLDYPAAFSAELKLELTDAGKAAVRESVVAGYRDFREFMLSEYLPAARGSIGAAALPHGRELYRHRVRMFTTLDTTPEAVHATGLQEVARIRKEMEAIPAKVGFKGDYAAFIEHLRTSPEFYPQTADELLKEVAYVLKRMDGWLPELFGKLPRTPYGIKVIPAYVAPRTTSAYYMPPAADGTRAGFYYVNTYNLRSRPLFEVEALSLHEAAPGHHLQLALQMEMTGLPEFRKFAEVTAFVEGWALYAERLGLEVGFYQDPYSDFGRLSFEMWRACRLVVDTGIHYLGWSRQQAVDFMADNTALSLHNIQAEVDRYIAWPGQALAYKTGELKIRELRKEAERALGDQFKIRDFHDIVLAEGAVPLTILDANVRRWIKTQREEGERDER